MLTRMILIILMAFSLTFGSVWPHLTNFINNAPNANIQARPRDFSVEFFPVAPYHVGDLISVRVTYTGSAEIEARTIRLTSADYPEILDKETGFSRYSQQATFYWVLDTAEFQPGFIDFFFEIPGAQLSWQQGIHLLPNPGDRTNQWQKKEMDCCTIHFITDTDAEEDLPLITSILQEQTQKAWSHFSNLENGIDQETHNPLDLVLVPIVIGHGGFATDKAVLTYSKQNWAGTNFEMLSHHEIIHVIDRQLNEGPRPSLLAEGLAVYLSGGHYQKGDSLARAAALHTLGKYLSLVDIADDFYAAQHEIGYMEAAALVAYMVERWGWEEFIDFYFNLSDGRTDSQIISAGLNNKFGMDLAELEADFVVALKNHSPDAAVLDDVRLTIEIYDMLRRYQTLVIPSAHFRTAWWPPIDQVLENGIVGDYAYREKSPTNIILESIFLEMHTEHQAKNYQAAEKSLLEIKNILDSLESNLGEFSHYELGWPLPIPSLLPIKP